MKLGPAKTSLLRRPSVAIMEKCRLISLATL